MREFTTEISQQMTRGMFPAVRGVRQGEFLTDLNNFVVRDYGIDPAELLISPFGVQPTVNFPFPQIMELPSEIFLLGQTSMWEIDTQTEPWSVESIQFQIPGELPGVIDTDGGIWHAVKRKWKWILFNGKEVRYKHNGLFFRQGQVTIKTGCYFKGRNLVGGFDPDNIWSNQWKEFMTEIINNVGQAPPISGINHDWVMWSSVGSTDFPISLFHSDGVISDDTFNSKFFDLAQRNEFGFSPLPFKYGSLVGLFPLGSDQAIAYQENGITSIEFSSQLNTFGFNPISSIGIKGRGCVGVSDSQHLILDHASRLWLLQPGQSPERLDYAKHLSVLNHDKVVITRDPGQLIWYISDGDYGFTLSSSGLSRSDQKPTSISYQQGFSNAIFVGNPKEGIIRTGVLDMETRGLKTLNSILVGGSWEGKLEMRTWFKYASNMPFEVTKWVEINPEGYAFNRVTALEFMIELRGTFNEMEIDYVQLKWQRPDSRYIRGPEPQRAF